MLKYLRAAERPGETEKHGGDDRERHRHNNGARETKEPEPRVATSVGTGETGAERQLQESAGQDLRIFHTNAHRLALEAGRVKSSKHEQEHDKGPAECVGADHGADGDVAPQPPGVGGVGDLDVIESDGDDGEIV